MHKMNYTLKKSFGRIIDFIYSRLLLEHLMRNTMRAILLSILVIISPLFLFAQSAASDSAIIFFDKKILDFGTAKQGESKTVIFTFTNKGNKPLIVSDALKGCGCTSVKWTKEPVMPGKQGYVWATFNSNIGYGHIMKPIHIHSNATVPQMDIYIQGELLNEKFQTSDTNQK